MQHGWASSLQESNQFDAQSRKWGGSPEGISEGKTSLNSCKRLVIGAGKVLAISSMENKASFQTKA